MKRAILIIIGFALCVALVFGVSFAKPLDAAWQKTSAGWSAELIAPFDTEYCFCPAYKTGCSDFNTINRKERIWGTQQYYIPLNSPRSDPETTNVFGETYRTQRPIYGKQHCKKKKRGDIVEIRILDRDKSLWLEIW
ncbi:hypothetical protein [Sulfitobacter donghicola]|uniref:Uncharacterized protein n=1 Tax=Sulfitobacter donghicola DSW-25 = KCTC 12864 = JCM 14565 TaxID=1300350 RepID=A0A073IEQ2_9RHOB|nr:hypothetical protein [Sulfitobacter donghicola]KEJ87961.1 hypothetical protein DSW25_04335 [Sulfitobacter donghicola DSW-25 = KCTC 12864 = JCM 14565]